MTEVGAIGFSIRPRVEPSQAQRGIEDLKKRMMAMRTTSDQLGKSITVASKAQEEGFKRVGRAAEDAGRQMERAFKPAVDVLDKVGRGMATIQSKFANLRTLFTTGIVGAVTVGGLMKVLRAGQANIEGDDRIRRKFRDEAGRILDIQNDVGFRTGRTGGEAQAGLSAILEAVQGTRAGIRWRGRKLTAGQADALRGQTFDVGRELFERIVTLDPALNPEMVGKVLAESAQNPAFGTMRLASILGMTRTRTRKIADAYRKNKLFELLGDDRAKQFGVEKGKKVGTGTLLEIIADEAGFTKQGVEDRKKRFDFQIRQMGSLLDTVIGDLGVKAFEKLNSGIAKGGNLAENLKKALESPKGREFIDRVASVIVRVVEGMASVVRHADSLGSFLDKHSGSLQILGGLLLGSRVYSGIKGAVGGTPGLLGVDIANELNGAGGGGGRGAGGALASAAEGLRGVSTHAGGAASALSKFGTAIGMSLNVISAALAGYGFGRFIDESLGISDALAGTGAAYKQRQEQIDNSGEGKSRREFDIATSLARKIRAGKLTTAQAQEEFNRFAVQTEGSNTLSPLASTISRRLARGDVEDFEKGGEDARKAFMRDLLKNAWGQRTTQITVGDVNIPPPNPNQSLPEILESAWPALKDEIIRKAETESAYGAAPMSVMP